MFVAIVMSIYGELRKNKQKDTEALAELLKEDTAKYKGKWVNLLCCRMPDEGEGTKKETEDEEEEEDEKEEEDEDEEEAEEKKKQKEEDERKKKKEREKLEELMREKKPATKDIFCFNLAQLVLFLLCKIW